MDSFICSIYVVFSLVYIFQDSYYNGFFFYSYPVILWDVGISFCTIPFRSSFLVYQQLKLGYITNSNIAQFPQSLTTLVKYDQYKYVQTLKGNFLTKNRYDQQQIIGSTNCTNLDLFSGRQNSFALRFDVLKIVFESTSKGYVLKVHLECTL